MTDREYAHLYKALVTPDSLLPLTAVPNGLANAEQMLFKHVSTGRNVVDFIEPYAATHEDQVNLQMYNSSNSIEIYRNFLDWLFRSFDVQEHAFRSKLISLLGLTAGMRVLITGCGLGEDIPIASEIVGESGEVHAQDISKAMIVNAAASQRQTNTLFTISNATKLPLRSGTLTPSSTSGDQPFGDTRKAIAELDRVCKQGGRVVFGDEGIATHLRDTEYFKIAVCNNKLWRRRRQWACSHMEPRMLSSITCWEIASM